MTESSALGCRILGIGVEELGLRVLEFKARRLLDEA